MYIYMCVEKERERKFQSGKIKRQCYYYSLKIEESVSSIYLN